MLDAFGFRDMPVRRLGGLFSGLDFNGLPELKLFFVLIASLIDYC